MKVFVHAWYTHGQSAGFDWYRDPKHAQEAYESGVKEAEQQVKDGGPVECQYRYDVELAHDMTGEQITLAIDADLDDRSEASEVFWPANAKELTLALSSEENE
jgi:hypothetical protein